MAVGMSDQQKLVEIIEAEAVMTAGIDILIRMSETAEHYTMRAWERHDEAVTQLNDDFIYNVREILAS